MASGEGSSSRIFLNVDFCILEDNLFGEHKKENSFILSKTLTKRNKRKVLSAIIPFFFTKIPQSFLIPRE